MITYLYGTDKYRIKEYLREHAPGAMAGEEALKTQGLFAQSPVILYESPGKLKIPDDVNVFVVSEKKIRPGIAFQPLKGAEISQWISAEAKKHGFAIAPDAVALLTKHYRDTWQTKLELDKLMSYCNGRSAITTADVQAVASAAEEENIFRLTDAIANRRKRDAVVLLEHQLAAGADPYYLFSMIVFAFRNMIAPERAGVHPFAAQKARLAARRFAPGDLKKRYGNLHQLECDAKNGIRDMTDGLYQFVLSL